MWKIIKTSYDYEITGLCSICGFSKTKDYEYHTIMCREIKDLKKALSIIWYNIDHLQDSKNRPVCYEISEDDNDWMKEFLSE